MDRETWKLMFGNTPMPDDVTIDKAMSQWSPTGAASLGPSLMGGEDMSAAPAQWIQRGNLRMDNLTGALEQLNGSEWGSYAGEGYDPSGTGTNERLQMMYGFNKAPSEMDPSQYMNWAVQNGWSEPSRNSGMTMGEALLMMGGAAFGAGALNGLGGAGAAAGAADASAGLLPQFGSNAAYASGLGGSLGATGAGSGAMDLTGALDNWQQYFPDFGNYSGQMTPVPGLEQSLTQIPLDLSTNGISSALAGSPGLLDTIKNMITQNPSQATNLIKSLTGAAAGAGQSNNSLLGTALGGLLGSLNGSKQAGTTTVTQEPWSGQQPYLLDAFQKAKAASGGSPLQTQANSNYSAALSGPTTNPMLGMDNPYLTSAINNANADVTRAFMPAVNQANRASGSFGNSGVADTYGKNMADAYSRNATSMRMTDYTNQQNLQQQAVNNTLGFTSNANNFAAQPSQNYAQTVQGNYGGQTTTPYYNNPINGIMGGAMVGNSIGSNLGF